MIHRHRCQKVVLAIQRKLSDKMCIARIILWSVPHVLVLSLYLSGCIGEQEKVPLEEPWQGCGTFLAPSSTGWGVFAARDFGQWENVEVSSLLVPMSVDLAKIIVSTSVLDDYVYGYHRYETEEYMPVVLHGAGMVFNHHPEPNIQYYSIGEGSVHQTGFRTKRAIQAGEQLFSTYGIDDEGAHWFESRGMDMMAPEESIISSESLTYFSKEFCSTIYANIGRPFWDRLAASATGGELDEPGIDTSRFAPFDAGLGDARTKRPISKGERIEISSGLLLSSQLIAGTVLGGLVFSWQHLSEEHRASLRILRESGQLKLQGQDEESGWARVDRFVSYEDLSILPSGGNIGMVRRVGETEPSNCHLNILWHLGQRDSVSVTLELRATRDIDTGDVLLLDLPPAGTKDELRLLKDTMDGFGQPYFPGLFDAALDVESKAEL